MDDEMVRVARNFLNSFETVFGDDWAYTKDMLGIHAETPEDHESAKAIGLESIFLISPGGTFLDPRVEDEVEDWGNRGELLRRYRELKRLLETPS